MVGVSTGRVEIDLGALAEFQKGLAAVTGELGRLGNDATADTGVALESVTLSGTQLGGHVDLADDVTELVGRGRWLLHGGLRGVEEISSKLTDTRSLYQKAEDGAVDLFHRLLAEFTGDPTGAGHTGGSQQ